jgi:tetratricopeptide (TPR) repeat protein
MKKVAILASAILISTGLYAQKDELKTLNRIYDKDTPSEKDVVEFKAAVAKAQGTMASASEGEKVQINYFAAQAPFMETMVLMAKPENQSNPALAMKLFNPEKIHQLALSFNEMREYENKTGKKVYTKDIDEDVAFFGPTLLNYAIGMGSQKQYKEGAKVLYDIYLMDKKNLDNLYYAASYAVNGGDFDMALSYYDELKKSNYSGEGTQYMATSVVSGKEEPFNSKADRDKMVSLKTHVKPREEKIPSKRGEIYKNIALILVEKGKTEEAKTAFADAIKENPNDMSLKMNEANLYLKLKDNAAYKTKVAAILEKEPNNADLVYNLGVVAMEAGQLQEAETFLNKAIAIKPEYSNAYMNLAAIKLMGDDKVVTEMNKLTNSEKDNKRYEALKKQRTESFNGAMPYLEKAYALDPNNEGVIENLLSVYNFLELTDKPAYKELKAKMKDIRAARAQ